MKKIMVIGCCGAGKSTLSRKLHRILNIELYHLDQYYWKPNWEETGKDEWVKTVKQLASKDNWIIDGNYSGTLDIRIENADTIIFLDYSTISCVWRVIKRIMKYYGRRRPDMPKGCNERFDIEFLHYVATFNLRKRRSILRKLALQSNNRQIIRLKNDKETNEFLKSLESTGHS